MTNYIFLAREWNTSFFVKLRNRIREINPESTFQFLTMQHLALLQLLDMGLADETTYLPEWFGQVELNESRYLELDELLRTEHNAGINRVYDLERFKPETNEDTKRFKYSHTLGLDSLMKEESVLISLTMDHFVYVMAALLNELKGGENYFLQPVGFPQNANVIFANPWKLRELKTRSKGDELERYIDSLNLRPEESIHYMKKVDVKAYSMGSRILDKLKRLQDAKRAQKYTSYRYTYLDNQLRWLGLIPTKIQNTNGWYKQSVALNQIHELSKAGKLFYFPLQLEPEMSTLAYSPWVRTQAELIRLISMTLHVRDTLIIKENPKMKGQRNQSFYDEINKLDNVKWADFDVNSRDIIRLSFKTISVTGTACIEAACLGRMSLIVGYSPWKMLLIQRPLTEKPLIQLEAELYYVDSGEEVKQVMKQGYSVYEKSLYFDNLIPLGNNNTWNCAAMVDEDASVDKLYTLLSDNLCVE